MPCTECQAYIHDADWKPVRLGGPGGDKAPRHAGIPTPCGTCPKVPQEALLQVTVSPRLAHRDRELFRVAELRKAAVEVSGKVLETIVHYLECRAVGAFPDDPIVRRNAAIIRDIEDDAERARRIDDMRVMAMLMKGGN